MHIIIAGRVDLISKVGDCYVMTVLQETNEKDFKCRQSIPIVMLCPPPAGTNKVYCFKCSMASEGRALVCDLWCESDSMEHQNFVYTQGIYKTDPLVVGEMPVSPFHKGPGDKFNGKVMDVFGSIIIGEHGKLLLRMVGAWLCKSTLL